MNPANSLLRRQQQDKKNQTITVIKHFDPRNTNRLLSDSLPELNIDMENFMNKNIKVGTVKKSKIKPNKNNNPPDNDNNIKMTNDKNSIELSTNKAKKTNYKKDKKTPTTKRNKVNSKIDDESKSLKNERIETNLTNIDKGSKIRLSIKPKKCKKPPKKTDEETNLKTYRSLKELHKEISNSRKTLKRSRTVNADTGAKTDDYVEGLKKEITKNRVKSKKKSCDIIEKLKKEIEEYRKNKQNGAVAAMSPEAVIDKADTNLQTEEASAPVDETTTTKGDIEKC